MATRRRRAAPAQRPTIGLLALRPNNLTGIDRLSRAHQANDADLQAAGGLGERPVVVLSASQTSAQPRWAEAQVRLASALHPRNPPGGRRRPPDRLGAPCHHHRRRPRRPGPVPDLLTRRHARYGTGARGRLPQRPRSRSAP